MKQTKITLPVVGMDCASCANTIKHVLLKTPGVISADVFLTTEKADIVYTPSTTNPRSLNQAIKKYGYHFNLSGTPTSPQTQEQKLKKQKQQITLLFPVSLFVFLFMTYETLTEYFSTLPKVPYSMEVHKLTLFTLATAVMIFFGGEFLRATLRFFRTGVANMDSLVGLGTLTAFIYSTFIYLFPSLAQSFHLNPNLYFDVPIVIIGFIKLGKFLEANSKQKTKDALQKLIALSAKTALVQRGRQELEIPLSEVVVGDIVIVKPGSKIPVDGVILEGQSTVDESAISGESLPVDKKIGDFIIGGTLNHQGYLKFTAQKVGQATLLSRIIDMVEKAQNSKAPIESLADKISSLFVPVVLVIAFLSLLTWILLGQTSLGIISFVGIMVIACPCALGLAIPTAIVVAVGKGAQNGLLIKDASALEKLNQVDTLVFDKTGTLTKAQPTVDQVITTDQITQTQLISIAASLEKSSEHPIAKAVVNYADQSKVKLLPVTHFQNIPGIGVKGSLKSQTYYLTQEQYLHDHQIPLPSLLRDKNNGTAFYLTQQKNLLGLITVTDPIKDSSLSALKQIHALGLKTVMLTGDQEITAQAIASQLGITEVRSRVLPDQKAAVIKSLQDLGHRVAMIGDGINDAPALAQADVSLAMSTGTDIAIDTADITVLKGDLTKVITAIRLSKATINTIHQNLFWAFFYNLLSIPVAAGLLYPLFGLILNPALAGAAMAFSSVSVVTNSLRLKSKTY